MNNKLILTGCALGIVAIILGAFGAHALKKVLSIAELATLETGVRYQMYHALFLLFVGTTTTLPEKSKKNIYYLVLLGVFLFSGSIYLLATKSITLLELKIIGPLTPIGGFLLIMAWCYLFLSILKTTKKK